MNYEDCVKEVLGSIGVLTVGTEEISADDGLNQFGITSLNYIQLVVKLEKKYNIKFGMGDLDFEKMNTIGKIAEKLENAICKSC